MNERQMTLKEAYMRYWTQAFDFRGRARRKAFWVPILINFLICFLTGVGLDLLISLSFAMSDAPDNLTFLSLVNNILILFQIATFIPNLSVTVRRLHDVGYSGWLVFVPFAVFVIIFILIFVVGFTLPQYDNQSGQIIFGIMTIFFIIMFIMSIWIFILTLLDSSPGMNKWGRNPKETVQIQNDSGSH